ncbi:T9SS type A sorting domain-containing protein [Aequorivita sp. H23M31]|uniref:T9SS type A sorting domain-containing protein n=1 Tax=Aequorivita ciconiae TaxID=2494375 RepID=A0A410G5D1_9FLAO|nr:T9SS type A sorting domain-containing protein [Aequorivita sp. H23M31]QAA82405.1 T9SS type A sorting domain-containing protein [Aequorivita sp. H23M31]
MKKIYFTALVLGAVLTTKAQVYDVGSFAQVVDISNTGTAVGNIFGMASFMWTENGEPIIIGEASESGASGNQTISADGSLISCSVVNPDTGIEVAALYRPLEDEWIYLEGLGVFLDDGESSSWGMSSNGEHVVGLSWASGGTAHGVYWNYPSPVVDLGSTVTGRSTRANNVNADGTRIIGWQDSDFGDRQGVYWENGEQHFLTDNDGNILGEPNGISADGKTITGFSLDRVGYIWNEDEGTILYNPNADDPFADEFFTSIAAISDDGTVAVGFSFNPFVEGILDGSAFIWTQEDGFRNLNEYISELGYDTLGIDFAIADAISPDGKYIGGIGVNQDLQDARGFVIKLPEGSMGTNDVTSVDTISIFPNPAQDYINFSSKYTIQNVEIYNSLGQQVMNSNAVNQSLNIGDLSNGIYILKAQTEKGSQIIKFIKK